MPEVILEVSNLKKSYDNVVAVDGLDFKIKKGQCFGLLGPNGAGKTTTLAMLEGIEIPSEGEIRYKGNFLPRNYQELIGIQFQATALQDFLTPFDNLKLFSNFYDHPSPMGELILKFRLDDFLLALALVHNPEIVFLDEPTTGLDPRSRRDLWDIVKELKAEGRTLILTTHYMEEAEILCDELLILSVGRTLLEGTPDQLVKNANVDNLDALFLSLTGEDLVKTQEVIT